MLGKCANPKCDAHLKYMRKGSLYAVPKPLKFCAASDDSFAAPVGNQIECFWLCESCSPRMKISRAGELIATPVMDIYSAQIA